MPTFPLLSTPLIGERVGLRPAAERDIPEILIAHQDDPELYIRLGLRRPPSGAELGRRAEASDAERAAGEAVWLTMVLPGENDCVGQIDVHDIDADNARAELGIWVAPPHRGRGVGTGALAVAGRWLVGDCGLARVQLLTEPENAAMRRSARGAGFTEEGRLRGYRLQRGRRVDCVVFSLVAADVVSG